MRVRGSVKVGNTTPRIKLDMRWKTMRDGPNKRMNDSYCTMTLLIEIDYRMNIFALFI